MAKSIPDRWLDYKPIGEPIKGTRFIAFKVPLSPAINERIPDTDTRLEISHILEKLPNLGLVIDLTNTNRYYRPEGFSSNGVKHIKLMIPGKQLPPKHLVQQFTNYVKQFIESSENEGKLIGVHCTHGLNRTGYLVCHYMINNLQIQPEDAIKDFEEARGHQMERLNYLDSLKNPHPTSSLQHNHDSYSDQIRDIWNNDGSRHSNSWRSSITRSESNEYISRYDHFRPEVRPIGRRPQQVNYERSVYITDENGVGSWRSTIVRSNSSDYRRQYDSNRSRNPENGGRRVHNNRDNRTRDPGERRHCPYNQDLARRNTGRRRSQNGNDRANNDIRRRDQLPSNDFSSNYSVMDQLYGDTNQNANGRFNRR